MLRTRHHLQSEKIDTGMGKITEREPLACAFPTYNGLGFRNDMPIPLETELTDMSAYNDAYAFYLQRAKDAATDAERTVEQAILAQDSFDLALTQIENAEADAEDTIEQICGIGQTECEAPKADYLLEDLNLLPEINDSCIRISSTPRGTVQSPEMLECW